MIDCPTVQVPPVAHATQGAHVTVHPVHHAHPVSVIVGIVPVL